MKKKVNGKVIDIPNIELFELAFEGLALGKLVSSSISDTITEDSVLANKCISAYESIYKCLPFPLYAIETNIKYSMIVMAMRGKIEEPITVWVDSALYIKVEENKALKFVSNTWGIVSIETEDQKDNSDIELYSGDIGYKEFEWALSKLISGQNLAEYYIRFMGDFVKVCNKDPMMLKWELSKILEFGPIPERLALKLNKIIDIDTGSEFLVDVFSTGKKKTGSSEMIFDVTGSSSKLRKKAKYTQTYDFEVYEKKKEAEDINLNASIGRLKKTNLDGLAAVFETLVGKGVMQSGVEGVEYKGIMVDGKVVYQVGTQLLICNKEQYESPIEVGRNVEIYGYDNGMVYILKRNLCGSGISKESVYALNPKDMQIILCRIQYV